MRIPKKIWVVKIFLALTTVTILSLPVGDKGKPLYLNTPSQLEKIRYENDMKLLELEKKCKEYELVPKK